MRRQLKLWEISLFFGIFIALVAGVWLSAQQQDLADQVIRLHVIANSDSQEDQQLKLEVRDGILEELQSLYPEWATLEEVELLLSQNLSAIQAAGQAVVDDSTLDYDVSAQLTQGYFPTKYYDDFALPAGEYTALRITLGEGDGENWWCVAFPPLCLGAATVEVEEAQAAGLFTDDQVALMTETNEGYVLKFKGMELLGEAKEWISNHTS